VSASGLLQGSEGFHPPILEIEPAIESLEKLGWSRLCFGISGLSRERERGCRGGSADLVPTSWPLRSESALGSVVPLPCPPPRLAVKGSPEVH
jgi:hypothetical protein